MTSEMHRELNRHSGYSNRKAAPTVLGSFRTSITAPSCVARELSAGISLRERPRSRTGYGTLLMDHDISQQSLASAKHTYQKANVAYAVKKCRACCA
jgi:hypothetical protein